LLVQSKRRHDRLRVDSWPGLSIRIICVLRLILFLSNGGSASWLMVVRIDLVAELLGCSRFLGSCRLMGLLLIIIIIVVAGRTSEVKIRAVLCWWLLRLLVRAEVKGIFWLLLLRSRVLLRVRGLASEVEISYWRLRWCRLRGGWLRFATTKIKVESITCWRLLDSSWRLLRSYRRLLLGSSRRLLGRWLSSKIKVEPTSSLRDLLLLNEGLMMLFSLGLEVHVLLDLSSKHM